MDFYYDLFETVVITANMRDHGVLAGDLGAVVDVHSRPQRAYEVEFVNPDGTTRALLTLALSQIRKLSLGDVLTTRQLPLAA